MDARVCREYLAAVLAEETAALGQLEALLQHERSVLGGQDRRAIEEAARTRQARVAALARIEEQRRALCVTHGHSADRAGLDHLMTWCDPNGSLIPQLRECAQRAVRCRELNDTNGMIVSARLRQVQARLAVLTGRPGTSAGYDQRGAAAASSPKRALGAA